MCEENVYDTRQEFKEVSYIQTKSYWDFFLNKGDVYKRQTLPLNSASRTLAHYVN